MALPHDYRYDWGLAVTCVEAQLLGRLLEVVSVSPEVLDVLGLGLQHVDGCDGGRRHGGRVAAAEKPCAALVPRELDQGVAAGDVAAYGAVRLAECAHLDVDLFMGQAEVAYDASAAVAEDAFTVGVVHVDHGSVLRA